MSNIYINEPPTSGKVLMKTTAGDIDIELWCKETPKTCRNFIQLCMENFYNDTIFHRVIKGFIVQGGDPTGTGLGGESIYGEPFKDEFHSRLRFERRGLVAMANAGKDDNLSQFFFTMGPTQELQSKHTIFGKVTGSTVFNMLRLQEGIVDHNDRPEYPHKIISTEILRNPFDDIVPRDLQHNHQLKDAQKEEKKSKSKSRATKDFKLLSFGDEAEEEEEEINFVVHKDLKGKSKSSHDLIKNDPKLSSKSVAEVYPSKNYSQFKAKAEKTETNSSTSANSASTSAKNPKEEDQDGSIDKYDEQKKKMDSALENFKAFKRELKRQQREKDEIKEKKEKDKKNKEDKKRDLKELLGEEYTVRKFVPKKAEDREQEAMEILKKFQNKLKSAKTGSASTSMETKAADADGDNWLAHQLITKEDDTPVLAKDANLKDNDWYDIYDPRSKISKQRRETSSKEKSSKKRQH